MSGRVPAHLFLGGLGSGKTTTLLELLKTAPGDERWAVFVNEFGSVSLDPTLIADGQTSVRGGLLVREVHGGCICCSSQDSLEAGIADLLHEVRPDRLLIEPTGLADASRLVPSLRAKGPDWGMELLSVIGHLDIRRLKNPRIFHVPFLQHLLASCDHLLLTKADRAGPDDLSRFASFSRDWRGRARLYPERASLIAGNAWQEALAAPGSWFFSVLAPEEVRDLHGEAVQASGWVYPLNRLLWLESLMTCLDALLKAHPTILRIKGLLRTREGWKELQWVPGDPPDWRTCPPQADSRLVLLNQGKALVWPAFESLWVDDAAGTASTRR